MWLWLISAIAGSIIGSATESWFSDTKLGIWFYNKVDRIYTWANKKYGLKLLTDEEDRMKKFPQLSKRLETLESQVKQIQRERYDDWK